MTGSIYEIELITFPIVRVIVQRHTLSFDSNTSFTLNIKTIENLFLHLTIGQTATHLYEAICQSGFAMIDVSDNGEISNVA